MNNKSLSVITFIIGFVLFILMSSLFAVDQRQFAVVFRFGEAVRIIEKPGLKFKIPLIETVDFFDNRILTVAVEAEELTAADEKRVLVDAFAKFKIVEPLQFYKKVNTLHAASVRLNKILESSMRRVIGKSLLTSLIFEDRKRIMSEIQDAVNEYARELGVDIIDVRILRTDLPKENSAAIYSRMQTDRQKEAKQIRAEGQEEAAKIIAKADKEVKIMLAEAYMKSETIKGEGDQTAAKIYNDSYSKDPDFYKLYRSLTAYETTFADNTDTKFIISTASKFLEFLNLRAN